MITLHFKQFVVGFLVLLLLAVLTFSALPSVTLAQTTGTGSTAGSAAGNIAGSAASCAGIGALGGALGGGASAAAGAAASKAASAASLAGGIVVTDPGLTAVQTSSLTLQSLSLAAQTTTAGNTSTQTLVTCMLNGLAWTVAKTAIQSITRSTVNWINSGFNGSPAFVTDLQANLNVLSDTVAENFFQQLSKASTGATGFNLTSPFQDQVTQQLRADYYKQTGSALGGNQYNLSSQSSNPQAFLNGNFNQGGFNAFLSANSNPANNPFGAYLLASNALWSQIDSATAQRQSEVTAGKGFLSWRGNCSTATTTPSLQKSDPCVGSPIKTPGSIIESQLENQLGSGVRQLELADSVNEIVGALAGQLVNQVLGSGGLSGVSQPTAGGGTSILNQATSPSQYTSSLTTGVTQTMTNDIATLTTYRANWQKILDAATAAQQTCGVTNTTIASVVSQATTAVANANTALQQETALSKTMQTASASTAADAQTQLTTAITQYQSYLGAATTPSATDEATAAAQSADTAGTLYSQMVAAKTSCPVST